MKEVHATSSVIVGNIYAGEGARSFANSAPSVNFVMLTFVDHVHLSNAQANIANCCMSIYIYAVRHYITGRSERCLYFHCKYLHDRPSCAQRQAVLYAVVLPAVSVFTKQAIVPHASDVFVSQEAESPKLTLGMTNKSGYLYFDDSDVDDDTEGKHSGDLSFGNSMMYIAQISLLYTQALL